MITHDRNTRSPFLIRRSSNTEAELSTQLRRTSADPQIERDSERDHAFSSGSRRSRRAALPALQTHNRKEGRKARTRNPRQSTTLYNDKSKSKAYGKFKLWQHAETNKRATRSITIRVVPPSRKWSTNSRGASHGDWCKTQSIHKPIVRTPTRIICTDKQPRRIVLLMNSFMQLPI